MTKSTNHPNADYTPADIGPPQSSNGPETDFDREAELLRLSERKDDDGIPY